MRDCPTYLDKVLRRYTNNGVEVVELKNYTIPDMTPEEFKKVLDTYKIVFKKEPIYYMGRRCKGICSYFERRIYLDMNFLDLEDILIHEGLHGYYPFLSEYFIRSVQEKYMRNPEIRRIAKEKILKVFKN